MYMKFSLPSTSLPLSRYISLFPGMPYACKMAQRGMFLACGKCHVFPSFFFPCIPPTALYTFAVRCYHDGADWIARLFTMHNSHVSPRAAIKSVRADDLYAQSTGRKERKILPYATRVDDYNVVFTACPRQPPPKLNRLFFFFISIF